MEKKEKKEKKNKMDNDKNKERKFGMECMGTEMVKLHQMSIKLGDPGFYSHGLARTVGEALWVSS